VAFALVTASELHNQSGLGALIAEARRAGVKPIALTTGLFNEPALRLYRRCGFEEVLRREDAVRMIAKFE
jgi:GNAT superfamily N-acetyltransferase